MVKVWLTDKRAWPKMGVASNANAPVGCVLISEVGNHATNPATPECMAFTFQQSSEHTSVTEFKMVSKDTASSGLAANPSVGAFYGSFTNCTINISLK